MTSTLTSKWSRLSFFRSNLFDNTMARALKDKDVLPHRSLWFDALESTPPDKVRVVILGQDPHPTKGHAHGLAFSVQPHVKPLPPSTRDLLLEYQTDLGFKAPRNGDLDLWTTNGVLLLNSILTVREGKPLSHQGIGWEKLTHEIVRTLSEERSGLVWMLLGSKAQEYTGAIDASRHLVLSSGYPGSLTRDVATPFLGSRPFSKACDYLGVSKDMWRLQ